MVLEKTKKLNKKCQMIEVKTIIDFSCELLGLLINPGGLRDDGNFDSRFESCATFNLTKLHSKGN